MLFNSLTFLIYLPIVFLIYWGCKSNLRLQNLVVVVASYVFYGWWDWRFLFLIAFTSLWAYFFGFYGNSGRGSRFLLALSVVVNVGILGYFKYYNFFLEQFVEICHAIGLSPHVQSLGIILPVGISFYTFQALSYTIDVYRHDVRPTRDPIAFFAFISFFPQLVAGPIERATNLLPQFLKPRSFDYCLAVEGLRQMLWGFLKKVLVADYCAVAANSLLSHGETSCVALWCGMFCFTFQIYGDFSGYSDIAIGCSKLFGIRLMRNFAYPYFARDIAEFWRRWHISLTTWFRDYLYIPLGGSRCCTWKRIRNTFAIFLVSGFWHGANWTFIGWGCLHAICFLPLLLTGKNRRYVSAVYECKAGVPKGAEFVRMVLTFLLVVIGWTFFRATDLNTAFRWIGGMLWRGSFVTHGFGLSTLLFPACSIAVLLAVEWMNRDREIPRFPQSRIMRWGLYIVSSVAIITLRPKSETFIYFQF